MESINKNMQSCKFDKDSFECIDYVVSCDLLKNYSSMRIIALGGAITLLVSLLSITRTNDILKDSIHNIILILTNYISIRVIGSINSNVYARCLHLEWIESKCGTVGFFTYWNKYVLEQSKNASSNAFLISCIGINYIGIIVTVISISQILVANGLIKYVHNKIVLTHSFSSYAAYIILLLIFSLCIISFLLSSRYISKNMKTKNLIPVLRSSLEKDRDSVHPKKIIVK